MASRIQVVTAYGPRLESAGLLTPEFVEAHIESRTGYTAGTVAGIQMELRETTRDFSRLSMGVVIEGMGIVRPWIQHSGKVKLRMRFDPKLEAEVSAGFALDCVRNSQNIGLPMQALVEMWNRDHPDDPVLD